jgi:hypothetical protein
MNAEAISVVTLLLLVAAIVIGMQFSAKSFSADTKETVKLATNLVATMSALVLGLLVSSAKNSYDVVRSEVIDMSAKVVFLDRVLVGYGPEAAEANARLREAIQENINQMWPNESGRTADLTPMKETGNRVYMAVQNLRPRDDAQRSLKTEATNLAVELGKIRTLLVAQSVPSISKLMLGVLISWLVIIFFSFSMLAPTNIPAVTSLIVSALSVCGAICLILELDRPFGGLIGLSSDPMHNALAQLEK